MKRAPTIKAALSCFAVLSLAQASPGNAGPLAITSDDSQGGGYGFRIGQQCVILTAAGNDTQRERAMTLGATDFMTKPFSPKRLLYRTAELAGVSFGPDARD